MQMSGFDYIRLHRRAALAARVSLLTVVACLAVPSAAAELGAANAPAACAQIGISARAVDFRLRDSTPELRFEFGDNTKYHYEPAINHMKQGEHSRRVIADLDFLLARWPNHPPALKAMIEYELAGGKPHDFAGPLCYLQQARRFSPDDVKVPLLEGFYRWKKTDVAGAIAAYQDALSVEPESLDAHYNLGLLYIETKQLDKAREHAAVAYAAGYPLQGLRRKLSKLGYQLPP
jgi:tetratricopeptide (TPR) repeat protein